MAKFDQRNQRVDGDQINVGKDLNIINPIFPSDTVVAQLLFSITIQWATYIAGIIGFFVMEADFSFFCLSASCLYPLILIPHALYSFFVGLQKNNRKVMGMSVVAGISPVLNVVLIYLLFAIVFG